MEEQRRNSRHTLRPDIASICQRSHFASYYRVGRGVELSDYEQRTTLPQPCKDYTLLHVVRQHPCSQAISFPRQAVAARHPQGGRHTRSHSRHDRPGQRDVLDPQSDSSWQRDCIAE